MKHKIPFSILIPFMLSISPFSFLRSQDCQNDTLPPVIICKDSVTLRFGWCGNEMIYPSEFIQHVSDNCSLQSISFDRDGMKQDLDILHFHLQYGNSNTIPIYATDSSGNVGSCLVYYKISDETFYPSVTINLQVFTEFYNEDYDRFKIGLQSQDAKVFWNSFNAYKGSKLPLNIGDYITPKNLRVGINENQIPERSLITTSDMIMVIKHILGIQSFEQTINKLNADINEDGTIDIRDVKAQYDHIIYMNSTDSLYKPKYKASFVEPDGRPLADSIEYSHIPTTQYYVSLDQLGNINRSIPFSQIIPREPLTQFNGPTSYWETKDIFCKKGQSYLLRFRLTDSSYFFAIQSGLEYLPECLKVDTIFKPNQNVGFYSKILPNAVRTIFFNRSNPILRSFYPEFYLQITALKDFKLSDGFRTVNTDMSQVKVNYDGQIFPVTPRFTSLKTAFADEAEIKKTTLAPNPSTGLIELNAYFPEADQIELILMDAFGRPILQRQIPLISGHLNYTYQILQEGLYFIILKHEDKIVFKQRIIINNH